MDALCHHVSPLSAYDESNASVTVGTMKVKPLLLCSALRHVAIAQMLRQYRMQGFSQTTAVSQC